MTLDPALELSIEQLVRALNKKLFVECTRVQSAMPPMSPALVATLTAEIDDLEKRAKGVLQEVISLRNSLRPVNRIPPEVIALCATFVSHSDPRPIVSLTHVCRYWRRAIASSPRNWASISNGWKKLVPLCIERAGVVPLTVDIAISDIRADTIFLKAFLTLVRTPRITHVSLTGCSSVETVANAVPDFFPSTIHTLTSLELQQTIHPVELFPSGTLPVFQISWKLPKLKSLRLTRIPLYPALASVTSLVELKLVGYTTPFNFGKFIEFLRSNPNLELIILDIQLVEHPVPVWISPLRVISFPHLRHLSITSNNPTDARGLISSVSLPQGAHLEVVNSQVNPPADLRSFLPSYSKQVQEVLTPITIIKYQTEPRVVELFGNNSRFSFRCQTSSSFDAYSEFTLFTVIAVREFHLKASYFDDHYWQFSRLPALETFVLANVSSFPLRPFAFLAEEPTLCPSLKTIAFFDCNLDRKVIEDLEDVVAKRKKTTAAWLHRVVIVRKTGALPDHKLIHRLRKSVPHVDARIDEELPDL